MILVCKKMEKLYWNTLFVVTFHFVMLLSLFDFIPILKPLKHHRPEFKKDLIPSKRVVLFIMDYLSAETFHLNLVSCVEFVFYIS